MKTIKTVSALDPAKLISLGTYAAREVSLDKRHCDQIISSSIAVWELSVDGVFVGYAGIACETFLADNVFWCLFGEVRSKTVLKAYREFSRMLHQHYPHAVTYVEQGWKAGERFADFCGFVPTDQKFAAYDKEYVKHKRKN